MLKGEVKWFDEKKGYGFIAVGDEDYFVHFSEINAKGYKKLNPGDLVSFEVGQSKKGNGVVARNVTVDKVCVPGVY